MSLPSFPTNDQTPTRDDVINQIISSIAMEELGLSHIINTEGEKLQYALGTIPDIPGPDKPATIEDLLALNQSVRETLDSTAQNQMFLKSKLQYALSAATMQGPPGPPGPMTTILDSYDSVEELKKEHPKGNPGDAYLVKGVLYVWDADINDWKATGDLTGPQGPQGTGTIIKGTGESKAQLDTDYPDGPPEDAYLVDGVIYIWNENDGWHSAGSLRGPQGIGTLIKDTYPSLAALERDHPEGPPEDAYLIDGELYVWTKEDGWHSAGDLRGPQGTGTLIKGTYPSLGDLERNHPNGPPEDAYIIDAELYIWSEDKGWHSAGSLRGPQGIGTLIKDSYPSLEELKRDHPEGPPEDAYLIDGKLYVWTKEDGWHSVGDLRGPEASSYTIIPFASTEAPYTYSRNGEPTTVSLLGFGYGDRRGEPGPIGLADYSINIEPNNHSFTLNRANGNQNKQVVFSLPFNMLIKSIYITVGTSADWTFPSKVYPYVQLYMADPGTNNFVVIPRAIAMPTDPIGPGAVGADTMLEASVDGLNIPLKAGTRIAIGAMMKTEDSTLANEGYWLYFTGGIGMAYDPNPAP